MMTDCTTNLLDRLSTADETGLDATYLVPLLQLLAAGDPVEVTALAAAAGRTPEETRGALAKVPDTEYDEQGRIVGQGLTLRPTAHRLTVDGQELYTWCSLDTLILPRLLGTQARVGSVSAVSGEPIRLTVGPDGLRDVEPASAVVSLVNPDDMSAIRSSFCNQVHFFTSTDDAASWLEANPSGHVLSVAQAFEFGAQVTEAFLADQPGGTAPGADASGTC